MSIFLAQKFDSTGLSTQQTSAVTLFTPVQDMHVIVTVANEITQDSTSGGATTNTQINWTDAGTGVACTSPSIAGIGSGSGARASTNNTPVNLYAKANTAVTWTNILNDSMHSGSAPGVLYNVRFSTHSIG